MRFFFRYLLPITYFQASRLNRWALVGYHGLVEWLPAFALSFIYAGPTFAVFRTVLLSYLAFICIYEVGYLSNDYFSERYETDPRGRKGKMPDSATPVYALLVSRLFLFVLVTWVLGCLENPIWLTFHGALLATFVLHNSISSGDRIPTFYALATFRFFGPVILTLDPQALVILLPTVMVNISLYRTTVYLANKTAASSPDRHTLRAKLVFYLGCLPLSVFLSVFFKSVLPAVACAYFMMIWSLYFFIFGGSLQEKAAK